MTKLFFAVLFISLTYAQQPEWRTAEWEGRQVRGQVMDGDFVVEGDIVLAVSPIWNRKP